MNTPDEVKKKIEEAASENCNGVIEHRGTFYRAFKEGAEFGYRLVKYEDNECTCDAESPHSDHSYERSDCFVHPKKSEDTRGCIHGTVPKCPACYSKSEAVPSDNDERDAEDARKAKGYKDSENFYDPYLDTAIVERKKSDAFRDGFLAGRKGMVSEFEVERRVAEAVQKERERCWSVMCDDAKLFETVPNSFFDCVEHDILNPPEQS